eukprot:TRINITY_DN6516_c0_g2_i1.p1 TRINITY_DN6516_c0_g2~~TRINITY_DN6516_c0_g2_i1.p1  ORF type:complete len:292 (+),score=113.04 TRINITY_DN6516_c0_g2_i1:58-933(+)
MAQRRQQSGGAANVFQRQNKQHIREQQLLNKEQRLQEVAAKEKQEKRQTALKAQYNKPGAGTPQQQPVQKVNPTPKTRETVRQPPGEVIEVFIRETQPEYAQYYTVSEKNPIPQGTHQPPPSHRRRDDPEEEMESPGRATENPPAAARCGAAAGPLGAARRRSRDATPSEAAATPMSSSGAGHKTGKVPAYLTARKQQLQDEKDECARVIEEQKKRSKYPSGCVPLAEGEKTEILKGLEAKKNDLMLEINKLPMRFDTVAVRKRRVELEDQIREVETKITTFSRKVVYVPE